MVAAREPIRTPDQRLRVFVSSTLRELAPERQAARDAIERLRLAPVMFELGARPHPPRELYRSYLAQSDVFVGLYAEQYGWVAPGEEVSGLEDEYRLSVGMPSLIYVRDPAPDRQPRLEDLLDRIRSDDRVSYKPFSDAEELGRLIEDDLAILLAEHFDRARGTVEHVVAGADAGGIPAPFAPLVGRERERAEVRRLLADPATRIVTLTGPGGIGKSRLAIDIALDEARAGRDVSFTLLEAVVSPDRVIDALARALGVRDAATEGRLVDRVVDALADRDTLLVVDNMEHVLEATPTLMELVSRAPRLQLLVTSRAPLRVRPERIVEVGPLPLPPSDTHDVVVAGRAASVELFVQRAGAVRPGFTLSTRVVDAVVALCRALEGVPLAIELAAARLRSLTAEELLERLDMALSAWDGPRDLPERQRTLRATIAWSVDLLDEAERAALAALTVFQGAFTFDSAESVLVESGVADPAAAVAALVDASLVGRAADLDGDYRLLTSVRAFGSELATPEERERATVAWIAHYRRVVADSAARLRGPEQLERLRALDRESENIAAVARTLVHRGEYEAAAEFAWSLYLYLWIGGYLGVVRALMVELLATAPAADLAPRARAIALYYCAAVRFWQDPSFDPIPDLSEARDLFEHDGDGAAAALAAVSIGLGWLARPLDPDGSDGSDDPGGSGGPDVPAATVEFERSLAGFRAAHDVWGQAMALVVLGRVGLALGDPTAAKARFEESLALASAQGERLGIVIARSHRGWTRFLLGDLAGARDDFAESLDHSLQLRHDESIAYGLEGFVALRAVESDAGAAGRLLGVARTLRRRKGILNPGAFDLFAGPVQELRDRGLSAELDAAIAQGATMSLSEVLADVHD